MLTYEAIRKIIEDEKAANGLSKIPEDFFKKAKEYLDKKSQISQDWEFESAERRIHDIIDVREKKIINLAIYAARSDTKVENLTDEEKILFNSIVNSIKSFRGNMEKSMSSSTQEEPIMIERDLDDFVGINMKVYGPFKAGDVVTIPKPNADLLVKKEYARRLNIAAKTI